MADPSRIREHLETELRRVEDRLRGEGKGQAPHEMSTVGEGTDITDFYDQAITSEAKEMAYETRSRLVKRVVQLRDALRRLQEGDYGMCEACGLPIPERRLVAMPEAALCVPCQERRERGLGVH